MEYRNTYFLDIDGVLLSHPGGNSNTLLDAYTTKQARLLPGVLEKLNYWSGLDHTIIITSARPESMRDFTIRQLQSHGIFYDQLILGIPVGPRIVINDAKPHVPEMAVGITVLRNEGLINVKV